MHASWQENHWTSKDIHKLPRDSTSSRSTSTSDMVCRDSISVILCTAAPVLFRRADPSENPYGRPTGVYSRTLADVFRGETFPRSSEFDDGDAQRTRDRWSVVQKRNGDAGREDGCESVVRKAFHARRNCGSDVHVCSLLGDLTDVGKEVASTNSWINSNHFSIICSPRTTLAPRCEGFISTSEWKLSRATCETWLTLVGSGFSPGPF